MSWPKDKVMFAVSLGWAMARVETCCGDKGNPYYGVRLHICTPSCTDDGAHTPAESVEINGLPHIVALRDLLNKAIAVAHEHTKAEPVADALNQVAVTMPPEQP